MKKEKLLEIANMLDVLKPTNKMAFDMSSWKRKDGCGTTCCAIGWAVHKKMMPKSFKIVKGMHSLVPRYKGSRGMNAVQKYFNIPYDDAEHLFAPSKLEETPKVVSNRIRKYVRLNNGK